MLILIAIMLSAGVLGGVINVLRLTDDEIVQRVVWVREILMSIAAALATPLFLNMGSSQLVSEFLGTTENPGDLSKGLIFTGFCVVAAISARQFLDVLTKRLVKLEERLEQAQNIAKSADRKVEEVMNAQSDPGAMVGHWDRPTPAMAAAQPPLGDDTRRVHEALLANRARYTFRSLSGIAEDAGLSLEATSVALEELVRLGVVRQRQSNGPTAWYLTAGRG